MGHARTTGSGLPNRCLVAAAIALNLAEQFGHLSEADKQAAIDGFVAGVRRSGRYPHLVAMMAEGIDPDAADTRDARFDFGLGCLLDGIAARVPPGGAG
jgi:hypothetical protein